MKNLSFFISVFSVFLFSFFVFPLHSSAQFIEGFGEADVIVDMIPANPSPNQRVTISLDSYAANLDAANITWTVNGKNVLTGYGKKQFVTTTGKLGARTVVQITIEAVTGTVVKTLEIIPSSVDMIWQTNTYTPPFFKGRPLYSPESNVTFIALPHIIRSGNEISSKNLIYKWSNNGTVMADRSGYGQDSLTMYASILPRPLDIQVEVSDPVSGATASGEVALSSQQPFVLIYKNDPLYGVQYEKALQGAFPLDGVELSVVAVPYYFSTDVKNGPSMIYDWKINGFPINDGVNGAYKVFRRVGDTSGTSNISVNVSQSSTIFQTAKNNFFINFQDTSNQTNLF